MAVILGNINANLRILVQIDDGEPVEIGAGVLPLGLASAADGDRLVVKSDPASYKPAIASILREGAAFFERGTV